MSYISYLIEQELIDQEELHLESCDYLGYQIAKAIGCKCNGYQPENKKYWFTDMETMSSFMAADLEEAKVKLMAMREKFKKAA